MAAFGESPSHVAAAPGRVNLIGEHTDYNEGYVFPTPIPQWCAVAVGPGDGACEVHAADLRVTESFQPSHVAWGDAQAAGVSPGSWQSYVLGVMHEVCAWRQQHAKTLPPLRIAIASDVPIGSGLSSSAALEVALARAMLGVSNEPPQPTAVELAQFCQRAEHRFAGVPCGIMDQLTAAAGVPGVAGVIDCRTLQTRSVPLFDQRSARFVIIHSGVKHANASGEYAARRAACEAAARELGVPALRDADAYMLDHARASLDPNVYKCALHVVNENPRVLMAAEAMRAGDPERFGHLMNLSHASLRDLFRVSCPEVDALVETLQRTDGVYGARMTGAGFGGCVVALVRPDAAEGAIRTAGTLVKEHTGGSAFSLML